MSIVENKSNLLAVRRLALRYFAHVDFNNRGHTLTLSLECEVAHPKSIPNKNEHVRTIIEKSKETPPISPYALPWCVP
jgi:hypothetical protein